MNKPSKWVAGVALLAAALLGAAPALAHGHGRVRLGIGVHFGPYWGPFWGPAWYYPPPYYYPPAVVVAPPAAPPVYVQRGDEPPAQSYWYYCEASRGYYPYVKECPGGWKAVPPAPAPAK